MRIGILALCAALGCSASSVTNDSDIPTNAQWGGPEVDVSVTAQGATTQFVCAHGTIDQAIAPDANGNFSATGTYVYEFPATVAGQPNSESHSARYDGQVSGTTMRISVTVPDKSQVYGPFTATAGSNGPATRCQ